MSLNFEITNTSEGTLHTPSELDLLPLISPEQGFSDPLQHLELPKEVEHLVLLMSFLQLAWHSSRVHQIFEVQIEIHFMHTEST